MQIADGERIGLKRIKNKMEAPPFGLPPFYFYLFAFYSFFSSGSFISATCALPSFITMRMSLAPEGVNVTVSA